MQSSFQSLWLSFLNKSVSLLVLFFSICWFQAHGNWPLSHVEYSTFVWWSVFEHHWGMYKWGMAKDSAGNIFVIGMVNSTDYPTTAWAYQEDHSDTWNLLDEISRECAISKFDPTLTTLLASTYLWWEAIMLLDSNWDVAINANGTKTIIRGDDRCADIEIDDNDKVYITMNTTSNNLPTSATSYDAIYNGRDTYLARLDNDLTTVEVSTYFWWTSNELYGTDMEFAADGSIYFTSATASTNLPIAGSPFQATKSWSYDIYVAHMDANLSTLLHSTYIWGSTVELYNNTLTIDNEGDVVLRGHTLSTDYPVTAWAYQWSNAGWYDIVLSRFDPTLTTLKHSTYLGWSTHDYYSYYGGQVIFDEDNNLYLIWTTASSDYPVTAWVHDTNYQGGREMFISSLTADFSELMASTFVWWTSSEMGSSLEFLPNGNLVFLWATPAVIEWWATADAFDSTNSSRDNMLWIMTPDLTTMVQFTYMWATNGADYNYETDESLIIDGECVYFTSSSSSTNETFPLSTDVSISPPYQSNNAWNRDTIITKMCPASCGDYVTQDFMWETCDDGNTISGDGCSDLCQLEICGDGIVDQFHESIATTKWLIVYHTFDDTTWYDDSGRRNNVTEVWTIWSVPWVLWTAANYNDAPDRHLLESSVLLTGQNYTIAARVEFPLPNTWTRRTMTRGENNDHQILVRADGELGMYDNLYGGAFFPAWIDIDTLIPGRHHITAVWNESADTTTFYIDWEFVWTSSKKSDGEISSVWNSIWWSQARWVLDEFRVYDRILSVVEIRDIYTAINVYQEECDDSNSDSNDGCAGNDQLLRHQCSLEYCRDDAPVHDTSKNFVITDLTPTVIAWTSSQPNSEVAICFEDTAWSRDVYYTSTDSGWSFTYTPSLAPYTAPWVNVWIMLHDENGLDIDHHAMVLVK